LWDPSHELKQGADNVVYGLGPLYVVKSDATTVTLARDGARNVRAEVSSTGVVTGAFRYRAYGQIAQATTASPTYLGYADQLLDPSGLVYMRARWYDPATGRFLSRDPLSVSATTGPLLNGFAYAYANPIVLGDPSGLAATTGDTAGGDCTDVVSCGQGSGWLIGAAQDFVHNALDAGLGKVAETVAAAAAAVEPIFGPTTVTLQTGQILAPGLAVTEEIEVNGVRNSGQMLVRSLLQNGAVKAIATGGPAGALTQGITDFIFNPELTPGQRAGRIAIAGVIGIASAAVSIAVGGALLGTGAAFVVGWGLSSVAQKVVYPRLGLGG